MTSYRGNEIGAVGGRGPPQGQQPRDLKPANQVTSEGSRDGVHSQGGLQVGDMDQTKAGAVGAVEVIPRAVDIAPSMAQGQAPHRHG